MIPESMACIPYFSIYDINRGHNDGIIRTAIFEGMFGQKLYKLFEETKRFLIPKNLILKKGRGTLQYASSFRHSV